MPTTTTLCFGVIDQPYATGGKTTGEVAEILESKYGVMQAFYDKKEAKIQGLLIDSFKDAMEMLVAGRTNVNIDLSASATQSIQREFREFISSGAIESLGIPGVPTMASGGAPNAKGKFRAINHRLMHPYSSRNARRPSFQDTGLYSASFRFWMDR